MFCRQQVAQLRDASKRLENAGGKVVLVGMGNKEETEAFKQKMKVGFDMICDPDQKLYHQFGLGQMTVLDVFKPNVAFKGIKALATGHGVGIPVGDIRQLSGVFIITTAGKAAYGHSAVNPSDHPSIQEILDALENL